MTTTMKDELKDSFERGIAEVLKQIEIGRPNAAHEATRTMMVMLRQFEAADREIELARVEELRAERAKLIAEYSQATTKPKRMDEIEVNVKHIDFELRSALSALAQFA